MYCLIVPYYHFTTPYFTVILCTTYKYGPQCPGQKNAKENSEYYHTDHIQIPYLKNANY